MASRRSPKLSRNWTSSAFVAAPAVIEIPSTIPARHVMRTVIVPSYEIALVM